MPPIVPAKKKAETVRDLLEKMGPQLALALPRHITRERMTRVIYTEVLASMQRGQPGRSLADCTPASFAGAVLQCAALGLEPGVLGQAYLIPFRNSRRGTLECQLIPGYKGLLALARRSGQILTITPVMVREKDSYSVEKGTAPKIHHVPYRPAHGMKGDTGGEVVAYYAVAMIRGGGVQAEDMWRAEVEDHRARYARSSEDGPWVTHFDEMGLKTVLRKLCKFLPVSVETQAAVVLDETHEAGLAQDLGSTLPLELAEKLEGGGAEGEPGGSKLDAALAARKAEGEPEPGTLPLEGAPVEEPAA